MSVDRNLDVPNWTCIIDHAYADGLLSLQSTYLAYRTADHI